MAYPQAQQGVHKVVSAYVDRFTKACDEYVAVAEVAGVFSPQSDPGVPSRSHPSKYGRFQLTKCPDS